MNSYFNTSLPRGTGQGSGTDRGHKLPPYRPGTMAILCSSALFAACHDHDTQSGTAFEGPSNPLTSTNDGIISDSEVVATVTMKAPESRDFILSATVPVPPGTVTAGAMTVPLSVAGVGDIASPTQVEIVSRYPDPADGADVVHIMAHVRRPQAVEPGTDMVFKVGLNPHQRYPIELEEEVGTMLTAPGAIKLVAKDVMGHEYEADLLTEFREGEADVPMEGVSTKRIATHSVMLPVQEVQGGQGTMPHLMGVHSYLTVYRGQEFASLDLHVHNGLDGQDATTGADDVLDDLYFKNLDLRLPSGWKVVFAMDAPGQGTARSQGGYKFTEIVSPLAGGKMHLMPKMSHFVRRLVITRNGSVDRARELARSKFLAFCQPGESPSGIEKWSWWNEDTARYYAQNHALPELDYIGRGNVRAQLREELERFETQVRTGASGGYPFYSERLGWAHPWSVQYGGMTGGNEINTFAGVKTAWAASREGILMSQLRMSGTVDRQPNALFNLHGEPTSYTDLVVEESGTPVHVPLSFYVTPSNSNNPFRFNEAPSFQTTHVQNQSMQPNYDGDLRAFMPIDYQHFIRYTHDMKTLVWLTNDPLSRDLLQSAAETFRLGYHEFPNNAGGYAQGTGMLNHMRSVSEHPGMGVPMGRAEAWGVDSAVATYAIADDATRERYRPWMDNVANLFIDGQSTCTGNLMSYFISNYYNGTCRVRQAMENAFLENSIRGLSTTVYRDVNDPKADRLNDVLVDSVRASMTGRFFNDQEGAPYSTNAVGPADITQGNYCQNAPANTASTYTNTTEYYSSLAYAYQLTGDSFFLFRASQMLGGGDVWSRLQEGQGVNLANTAALVALAQNLQGMQ